MPGSSPKAQIKKILGFVWYRVPERQVRLPLIEARRRARTLVRTRDRRVGIVQLYLGGTIGHPAHDFADLIGVPSWPATKLIDGPHVDLYRRFQANEAIPAPGEAARGVPYIELALRCIDGAGEFCGCIDLDEVIDLIATRRRKWDADAELSETPPYGPALVRKIRGSDAYEIVDGHHRLARAWVRGQKHFQVHVTWSTAPPLSPPG